MARDSAVHPARLSLSSRLHGGPWGVVKAAVADEGSSNEAVGSEAVRRRVLEIGGRGEEILAVASHDPGGEVLSLREGPESVAAGREAAAEIGLSNVRFEAFSLDDAPGDVGQFDLVIAEDALARAADLGKGGGGRGVAAVEELFRLFRASLSETGILVIGYPVIPGASQRGLVRSLLGAQAGGAEGRGGAASEAERVAKAKAAAEAFRAMLGPSDHPYPQLLALELTRFLEASEEAASAYLDAPDAVFAHADVVRWAESHGLRFVCDARWNGPEGWVAPEIGDDLASRGLRGADLDQALDVLRCRAERLSIFCRADVSPGVPPGAEVLDELWITGRLAPAGEAANLAPGVEQAFSGAAGQRIASADPLLKAALIELHDSHPRPLRFAELVSASVARLHEAGAAGDPSDDQLAGVARDVWELFRRGLVELWPECGAVESLRSAPGGTSLNPLTRRRVERGEPPISPLGDAVPLDRFGAAMVRRMVGVEGEDALVTAMLEEAAKGGVTIEVGGARLTDPTLVEPMIRALVRRSLATLARFGALG